MRVCDPSLGSDGRSSLRVEGWDEWPDVASLKASLAVLSCIACVSKGGGVG